MYHHTPRPNEATRRPISGSFSLEDLIEGVKHAAARKQAAVPTRQSGSTDFDAAEFINEDGLAKRWWVSRKTLQRWRQTGGGIPHTKIGHRVIYAMSDVLAYEANAQRISTSERAK
jgi:hypothetical protein